MNNNYSLYNAYNAEFGLGKYFANKASKDIKQVMDSGATQDVIDDVVKRSIESGEKQIKRKVSRYAARARRTWKKSPKLRRNVKIAGVAGAGLVGLNALTGLKTVYDIGTGVKNKLTGKKREYSMFLTDVASFAQEQPKKQSELRNWGNAVRNGTLTGLAVPAMAGATYGAVGTLLQPKLAAKMGLIGASLGLGGYGTYRGGKALVNKLRGKKKETKNAQYSLFNPFAVEFAQNTTEQPKKKSLLKKAFKYGAIGGVGLAGLAGANRYGKEALLYHVSKRSPGIAKKINLDLPNHVTEAYDWATKRGGAKGQIKRDAQTVRNVFRRKTKGDDFQPVTLRID